MNGMFKAKPFEIEMQRLRKMCTYEIEARSRGYRRIAGVDEAGRGPLAGPVVAAAVILPSDMLIEHINDSKKLSARQREYLAGIIFERAISVGIGIVDEKQIDDINILNATKIAMKKSIASLSVVPDMILIDAVKLDGIGIAQNPIIKGDSLSITIAAASIIAKVTRDRIIDEFDEQYPQYGFRNHKGYCTKEHVMAIKKYGVCPIHRQTFLKNIV